MYTYKLGRGSGKRGHESVIALFVVGFVCIGLAFFILNVSKDLQTAQVPAFGRPPIG